MNNRLGIWQYIKNYKSNSLLVRNFLLIILLIVIPLLSVNVIVYKLYNNITSEEISKSNIDDVHKIRDIIDMVSLEVDRLSIRITAEPIVEEFFGFDKPAKMNSTYINIMRKIQNFLTVLNIIPSYIDSIFVYSEKNGYIISSNKDVSDRWEWQDSYLKNSDVGSWYANIAMQNEETSHRFLSNFRKGPLNKQVKTGVVIININIEKLNELLESKAVDRRLLMIDKKNEILYGNETLDISKSDINIFLDKLGEKEEHTFIHNRNGNKAEVISIIRSKYNDMIFVSIMPIEEYNQRVSYLKNFMTISIIFSVLLAVFVAFFVTIKVFNPIKKIMDVVNEPYQASKMTNDNNNEFGFIVNNISLSYLKNEQMKEELDKRQELINKAQSIALQAQINPHFLYNTLENINWKVMGLTGGKNEGSELISLLSQLLRLSLQTENYLIPIREEIEHARLYVEMQKIRYDDKFDVSWDVEDEVLDYKAVKISIQPLIENSIYHGIKQIERKGLIEIAAKIVKDDIVIIVSDNGVGLTDEQIDNINDNLQNDYIKENQHIGIRNVNQRIRLNFGVDYGLNISKSATGGTMVTMKVPKV